MRWVISGSLIYSEGEEAGRWASEPEHCSMIRCEVYGFWQHGPPQRRPNGWRRRRSSNTFLCVLLHLGLPTRPPPARSLCADGKILQKRLHARHSPSSSPILVPSGPLSAWGRGACKGNQAQVVAALDLW